MLEFTEVSKLTGAKEFGGCSWIHGYRLCQAGCNLWVWKRGLHAPQKPRLSGEHLSGEPGKEQWGGGRAVTWDSETSHRLLGFCQGNSKTFVVTELESGGTLYIFELSFKSRFLKACFLFYLMHLYCSTVTTWIESQHATVHTGRSPSSLLWARFDHNAYEYRYRIVRPKNTM